MAKIWFEDRFEIVDAVDTSDGILIQFASEKEARMALAGKEEKLFEKDKNCFKLEKYDI
jgi:hypothetical protein